MCFPSIKGMMSMIESSPSSPQGRPLPTAPRHHRDPRVEKGLWLFGIFAISFVVSLPVSVYVLLYGLMALSGSYVTALALTIPPLFAAMSASWAGTLLAPDRTRTRLLPVVGSALATAAVIGLIVAAGEALVSQEILRTPVIRAIISTLDVFIFLVPFLILLLSVSWATWHFRRPKGRMGRGPKLTLGLAVAVFFAGGLPLPLSVAGVVVMTSVALGVVLATWVFRRRGDQLGMDAALTLCLVALAWLIFRVADILYITSLDYWLP